MLQGRLPQLIAVLSATISAVSDGMHYGWTAPVLPLLQLPNSSIKVTETDVVWLENIYMLGGFAGLPITIYSVDKFGRKKSILIACVKSIVSWILIAFATSVEFLYVARFLSGMAGDVAFVSVPMYIGEIADRKIRGVLGSCIYFMMLLGIMILYSVAPFVSLPTSSAVACSFLIIQLLTFPFMPDSPYHLLLKGDTEGAKKSLEKLRANKNVEKELEDISAAVQRQKTERGRPIDLLIVKSNRKALLIMTVLNGSQHFSSISVMLMNVHSIIDDGASVISSNMAAIIFSALMFVALLIAAVLIDKLGRKILLTSSSILTGLSLLTLATYFAVKNSGTDISSYNWIPVAAVMLYAIVFRCGLGSVPIVMTAELFPTSVKAMGMTISDCSYVLFSVASIYMYQHLRVEYGIHVPFFIFSGSCFFAAAFALFYIPETKGKTLEEIQQILKGNPVPKRSSLKDDANVKMNEEDTVV
ncbi:hypothetical protein RN001_012218 [Aquatica leii]|uniref:Major facilitator superfamily (MFS) profile domain-containing protein n=1 Tax=Aquatica leii TaxID=1421715 RepID=A0AAN7P707_9COLE|nr:hypothetical protein RN001_012218 [Aquatica leii]